jgi:hypothetical protein
MDFSYSSEEKKNIINDHIEILTKIIFLISRILYLTFKNNLVIKCKVAMVIECLFDIADEANLNLAVFFGLAQKRGLDISSLQTSLKSLSDYDTGLIHLYYHYIDYSDFELVEEKLSIEHCQIINKMPENWKDIKDSLQNKTLDSLTLEISIFDLIEELGNVCSVVTNLSDRKFNYLKFQLLIEQLFQEVKVIYC